MRIDFIAGLVAAGLVAAGLVPAGALAAGASLRFELTLVANAAKTPARIVVAQGNGELRELVLDGARLTRVTGDGNLVLDAGKVRWQPPAGGGTLRYQVPLTHRRQGRNSAGNDAYVGERFALFRGDDAFPVQSSRRAARSPLTGELAISVPEGWSLVTPYLPDARGRVPVRNPGGRLARPLGWIIAGDIGTRRDVIAGLEVTVSAPRGLRMERIAMLGLLRWTLPELLPALGAEGPGELRYVNIVAAAEPMWLGALSAPNSVFVHAARPLISENGTSTIVHEMVHVLLADLATPADQDWIDEGLAEYLSLRALKDSGTISAARFAGTVADFRRWGKSVRSLKTRSSTGPVTARAVVVCHDLDEELRKASGGRETLLTLVAGMRHGGETASLASLRAASARVLGRPARALSASAVPGFD